MSVELVPMTKGGEVIEVHPSCVAAHESVGWRVVPPAPEQKPAPKSRKES